MPSAQPRQEDSSKRKRPVVVLTSDDESDPDECVEEELGHAQPQEYPVSESHQAGAAVFHLELGRGLVWKPP